MYSQTPKICGIYEKFVMYISPKITIGGEVHYVMAHHFGAGRVEEPEAEDVSGK